MYLERLGMTAAEEMPCDMLYGAVLQGRKLAS